MKNLLSVTIDSSPKILNYIIYKDIKIGEKVVIESERGLTIAHVRKKILLEEKYKKEHPEIIRVATNKDLIFHETKKDLEYTAKQYCLERIVFRRMKMKIVDVKYMLHSSKIIFYFTADGRIDFRSLVKDLASRLKSRIEMRQIGVRDQAQIIGGIGVCGRELCCHSFMGDFTPISLDDAKQSGFGNSDKLIGVCGRFMCCLKFEPNNKKCIKCNNKPKENIKNSISISKNNTLETKVEKKKKIYKPKYNKKKKLNNKEVN